MKGKNGNFYKVIYPGRQASSKGPDFVDAVIEDADRRRLCGDIEIHVRDSLWNLHGHHTDPRYNGVLFHVVLETGGSQTVTESGRKIPLLLMSRSRQKGTTCPSIGSKLPIPFLNFAAAGDERFANRSAGFRIAAEVTSQDQALYSGIMECLGYPYNKGAFRALAARLPWRSLHYLIDSGALSERQGVEDTLLWAAGMHPKPRNTSDIKLTGSSPEWVASYGRPANKPATRIKGAADLIFRMAEAGGATRYCEDALKRNTPASLYKSFEVRAEVGTSPIGKGRACEIVVNSVLPALIGIASDRRDSDIERLCIETYRNHPLLPENSVIREAERLLRSYGIVVQLSNAREQQGVIHCYKTMTSSMVRSRQLPLM